MSIKIAMYLQLLNLSSKTYIIALGSIVNKKIYCQKLKIERAKR